MSHAGDQRCVCVANHAPEPTDVEIHHIQPLYLGGPDTPSNRIAICPNTYEAALAGGYV